jgi:hypothetical protein
MALAASSLFGLALSTALAAFSASTIKLVLLSEQCTRLLINPHYP